MHPPFRPIAFSFFCLFSAVAHGEESLRLESSGALTRQHSQGEGAPVFIRADRLESHTDKEVHAQGDVQLRQLGQILSGNDVTFDTTTNEVWAKGNVRLEQASSIITGPELHLNLEQSLGYMEQPSFTLTETHGRGDAIKLLFEGQNKFRLQDARYTTCAPGSDDWFLRVRDLEIDRNVQIGTARNAYVEFKGVPLLYTPWMDFPLTPVRKSGFLAPSIGSTANSGLELTAPYYWNIAPNMDDTITPRLMLKRGLQVGNEFRYLRPNYSGIANVEVLPNDRVAGMSRYFLALSHNQQLGYGWNSALNVQKASDDDYFRDLSTRITSTSQLFLPREGSVSYAQDPWNFTAKVQSYQTLQDPLAPITPPYQRMPQFLLSAAKPDYHGADLTFSSEFVSFQHPTQATGKRLMLYPSASYPMREIYGYFTPKIGLNLTHYALDQTTTASPDTTRILPIVSADSGLFFERSWDLKDKTYLQTLEPRLFYLYVPQRNQSNIPIFDTSEASFNFAQIFSENIFTGTDRINDANQLTLSLTSRLLEPDTGAERLRAAFGQRYHFKNQEVTLASAPRDRQFSDMLFSLGGRLNSAVTLDTLLQYDPDQKVIQNSTVSARYLPEPGKTLNLSYRYNRELLNQIDISSQWPLSGRWYGLMRYNYSLTDSKVLEAIGGLEYNAGCWATRAVVHRLTTATAEVTNAFFVQLELNGVSQLGPNPLDILKQSIPGYTKTNEFLPVQ
jgi:LPS-assembly protein